MITGSASDQPTKKGEVRIQSTAPMPDKTAASPERSLAEKMNPNHKMSNHQLFKQWKKAAKASIGAAEVAWRKTKNPSGPSPLAEYMKTTPPPAGTESMLKKPHA